VNGQFRAPASRLLNELNGLQNRSRHEAKTRCCLPSALTPLARTTLDLKHWIHNSNNDEHWHPTLQQTKGTYRDPGQVPGVWVPRACGQHCSRHDSPTALRVGPLVPSAGATTAGHYVSKWHITVMGIWTHYVETWWMCSYSDSHCIRNFQTCTQIINNTCGIKSDPKIWFSTRILHFRLTRPNFTFNETNYLCLSKEKFHWKLLCLSKEKFHWKLPINIFSTQDFPSSTVSDTPPFYLCYSAICPSLVKLHQMVGVLYCTWLMGWNFSWKINETGVFANAYDVGVDTK
jgi:hypothetical protein